MSPREAFYHAHQHTHPYGLTALAEGESFEPDSRAKKVHATALELIRTDPYYQQLDRFEPEKAFDEAVADAHTMVQLVIDGVEWWGDALRTAGLWWSSRIGKPRTAEEEEKIDATIYQTQVKIVEHFRRKEEREVTLAATVRANEAMVLTLNPHLDLLAARGYQVTAIEITREGAQIYADPPEKKAKVKRMVASRDAQGHIVAEMREIDPDDEAVAGLLSKPRRAGPIMVSNADGLPLSV